MRKAPLQTRMCLEYSLLISNNMSLLEDNLNKFGAANRAYLSVLRPYVTRDYSSPKSIFNAQI